MGSILEKIHWLHFANMIDEIILPWAVLPDDLKLEVDRIVRTGLPLEDGVIAAAFVWLLERRTYMQANRLV